MQVEIFFYGDIKMLFQNTDLTPVSEIHSKQKMVLIQTPSMKYMQALKKLAMAPKIGRN